ncbi:MAG: hypothetical protein CM15mV116_010 [uncultured marine virus]|nr:MAG: hypothetical protein CM15mV116_010 [uncultured marine virus]
MNRKEQLNTLFQKYELDVKIHLSINTITYTRSGIDKIQAKQRLKLIRLKHYNPDLKTCIIKATGKCNDVEIQTTVCSPETIGMLIQCIAEKSNEAELF